MNQILKGRLIAGALGILGLGVLGLASLAQTGSKAIPLQFVNHLQAQLPEQDVFVEKVAGSGQVFRLMDAEKAQYLNNPVFSSAKAVDHNPFDPAANGPYRKGKALGMTLKQWLSAKGSGEYACANGQGTLKASFSSLVPSGVYTFWYSFLPMPPTQPFTGSLDLPLGARDGSQSGLKADADGKATYSTSFKPCLQLSGTQAATLIALAWHSDGKTYGSRPGAFGSATHIQVFSMLPAEQ